MRLAERQQGLHAAATETHPLPLPAPPPRPRAGALPDQIEFSSDCKTILVSNEGEPSGYGNPALYSDPEGSVSIIRIKTSIGELPACSALPPPVHPTRTHRIPPACAALPRLLASPRPTPQSPRSFRSLARWPPPTSRPGTARRRSFWPRASRSTARVRSSSGLAWPVGRHAPCWGPAHTVCEPAGLPPTSACRLHSGPGPGARVYYFQRGREDGLHLPAGTCCCMRTLHVQHCKRGVPSCVPSRPVRPCCRLPIVLACRDMYVP